MIKQNCNYESKENNNNNNNNQIVPTQKKNFQKSELSNIYFSSKNKFFVGEKVMIPRSTGVYNVNKLF
jgi:hypothetical protein